MERAEEADRRVDAAVQEERLGELVARSAERLQAMGKPGVAAVVQQQHFDGPVEPADGQPPPMAEAERPWDGARAE